MPPFNVLATHEIGHTLDISKDIRPPLCAGEYNAGIKAPSSFYWFLNQGGMIADRGVKPVINVHSVSQAVARHIGWAQGGSR